MWIRDFLIFGTFTIEADMIDNFINEYRFLSNFWPTQVEFEGIVYPSSENAYQAAKSLDPEIRKEFVKLTPGFAKRAGRRVDIRPDWNDVKDSVMETILREKFKLPELRIQLVATGDQLLVEGNTWGDAYWGVCNGVGQNKLGQLLMKIRSELQEVS